jgi:hypothetical protein
MDIGDGRFKFKRFRMEFGFVFRARSFLWMAAAAWVGCGLAACESVSVRRSEVVSGEPPHWAPERIYVARFAAPKDVFRVDRSDERLETFREEMTDRLRRNIVWRVGDRIAPASAVERDEVIPPGRAWLITGRFERVNQGSRAMRMLLGFGAGGTKVETSVIVYDLSGSNPKPFLRFETTGGSNAMPGAVASTTWWGAAMGSAGGMRAGLNFDTVRTSREITAALSEYLAERELIERKKALRPKRLGQWP